MNDNELMEKNHLRALVTLRVIARLSGTLGRAPKQRELVGGNENSALNEEWTSLGILQEYPFGFKSPGQLQESVKLLRDLGLIILPQNDDGNRPWGHYDLSPGGEACAALLSSDRWAEDWPSWEEVSNTDWEQYVPDDND